MENPHLTPEIMAAHVAENRQALGLPQQKESRSPSDATACSRSLSELLDNLDEWIDDALKNSKPIGLTLSRARVTITDQHDRIGEILSAMENQNEEVEKLRNAIRNLRDVSGRHHAEIATKRLFALLPENAPVLLPATPEKSEL